MFLLKILLLRRKTKEKKEFKNENRLFLLTTTQTNGTKHIQWWKTHHIRLKKMV
jgi:hypothetical protein